MAKELIQKITIQYISGKYLKAVTGVTLLALVCFGGLNGSSMAEQSDLAGEAQSVQPIIGLTTGGTGETGGADRHKVAGAAERRSATPGRPLTTRQKRLFVLGIGIGEKK